MWEDEGPEQKSTTECLTRAQVTITRGHSLKLLMRNGYTVRRKRGEEIKVKRSSKVRPGLFGLCGW